MNRLIRISLVKKDGNMLEIDAEEETVTMHVHYEDGRTYSVLPDRQGFSVHFQRGPRGITEVPFLIMEAENDAVSFRWNTFRGVLDVQRDETGTVYIRPGLEPDVGIESNVDTPQ